MKRYLLVCIGIACIGGGLYLGQRQMKSARRAERHAEQARIHLRPVNRAEQARISLHLIKSEVDRQKFCNRTELIDFVMDLVNQHTVHHIDKWHDENSENQERVLSHFLDAIRGDDSRRPHSSCGPRALIMTWILQEYGMKVRHIGIFTSPTDAGVSGHQQLEVFNPDNERWELYDPTWNVHFRNKESGERVSALQLYFPPTDPMKAPANGADGELVPSTADLSRQGWDADYFKQKEVCEKIADLRKFGAVMYYCFQLEQETPILVNTNRFDCQQTWAHPGVNMTKVTFGEYCALVYTKSTVHYISDIPSAELKGTIEQPDRIPFYR